MSRDFILVFSGGVVSLMTTLIVLFVMDYIYRRDQKSKVDRLNQAAASIDAANKNVAVPVPRANGSDQNVVVEQPAKAIDATMSVRQRVVDQTSKPKSEDSTQKVRADETSAKAEDSAKQEPHADQAVTSNAQAMVKPSVDASPKSKTDDSLVQKPAVDTRREPQVDAKTEQTPPVEQKRAAAKIDQTPQPKIDEHPAEKPTADIKQKLKADETAAHAPTIDKESQPAPVSDGKPKPPRVVPPESIKKKTREADTARPASKEHGG